MYNVHVRPSSDLRDSYDEIVKLTDQHDVVIITTNGVKEVALVNFEDFLKFEEYSYRNYVNEKLAESEAEAADPNTRRLSHEYVLGSLRKRFRYNLHDETGAESASETDDEIGNRPV